jgi:two-component system chemotaxis response regulator CheY
MKTLIVEDDVTSRLLLQELLRDYGSSQVATNGIEAVAAVSAALEDNDPYNLICLDIMMPEMDGQRALKEIRELESQQGRVAKLGARILMTTALHDKDNIMQSFRAQCDGYLVKPIDKRKLLEQLRQLELL